MAHIALFGGSFDPPHWGHVLAACYAKVAAPIDEVWVLPVARHPYGKQLSPWSQRWDLCQRAFAALPFVVVRDDEQHNQAGFTVTLVEQLRAQQPHHTWYLIGGTDTARDLPRWHRGAELATLINVIAVPRRGYDYHPAALPELSSSLVRQQLAKGQTINDLVPPAVAELIATHQWYRPL